MSDIAVNAGAGTLNVEAAATFLSMKVNTLKRLVREGNGPRSTRIARVLTFRETDLRDWLNKQFDKPVKAKTKRTKADPLAA